MKWAIYIQYNIFLRTSGGGGEYVYSRDEEGAGSLLGGSDSLDATGSLFDGSGNYQRQSGGSNFGNRETKSASLNITVV